MNSSRYLAFIEQALISGCNFLIYLFAARSLPKESWGELSLALGFILVIQGFQRAFVTIPMVTTGADESEFHVSIVFWQKIQLAVSSGLFLIIFFFFILSIFFFEIWIQRTLLFSVVLIIPVFYLEFSRRITVMSTGFRRLVVMSLAYSVALVAIVAGAEIFGFGGNVWAFVVALALAPLASIAVAGVPLWSGSQNNSTTLWTTASLWRFGRWAAASSIAYTGYNFAIQGILAALSGPAAVGVFAAARNLTQPINTLIQAIDTVDKPRAGRAFAATGMNGLWSVIRRSWKAMLIVAIPYFCFIFIFSEQIMNLLYGVKYADGSSAVRFWCFVGLAMIFTQPLETGLYVVRRPDWLFYGRTCGAVLVLIFAPWLIIKWSYNGALVALFAGWLLAGLFAVWQIIKYKPCRESDK